MSSATTVFGPHLMIDAYECDEHVLADADKVYNMLDELPDLIGMHKMTLPYIVRANANNHKDPGGWSGFVIIQESHISIHTFPKRGFATIDVYSCKDFDIDRAIQYFKHALETNNLEIHLEERGKKYPRQNKI